MLRRIARSLTPSQDTADDLVQEACERALSQGNPPEPQGFDQWMRRIILNLWSDREREMRQQVSAEQLDAACEATSSDGWQNLESHITLGAVRKVLGTLPAEQRTVMILVCVDGLSYQEAADQLGIPVGTVMSRLARGRLALMRNLRSRSKPSHWRAAE